MRCVLCSVMSADAGNSGVRRNRLPTSSSDSHLLAAGGSRKPPRRHGSAKHSSKAIAADAVAAAHSSAGDVQFGDPLDRLFDDDSGLYDMPDTGGAFRARSRSRTRTPRQVHGNPPAAAAPGRRKTREHPPSGAQRRAPALPYLSPTSKSDSGRVARRAGAAAAAGRGRGRGRMLRRAPRSTNDMLVADNLYDSDGRSSDDGATDADVWRATNAPPSPIAAPRDVKPPTPPPPASLHAGVPAADDAAEKLRMAELVHRKLFRRNKELETEVATLRQTLAAIDALDADGGGGGGSGGGKYMLPNSRGRR